MDDLIKLIEVINTRSPRILQANQEMCWAACISMILNDESLQMMFRDKINEYEGNNDIGDDLITKMPTGKNYFFKIFNDFNLKCCQFQTKNFPNEDFIINKIFNNKPIIISGIRVPNITCHAILLFGYKKKKYLEQEIFWILTNDPRDKNNTFKVAWIYDELINYNLFDLDLIDFVTNFLIDPVTDLEIDSLSGYFTQDSIHENSLEFQDFNYIPKNSKRLFFKNINEIEFFVLDYLKNNKVELFNEYFNIDFNSIENLGVFSQRKISELPEYRKISNNNLVSINNTGIFFYPIAVNKKEGTMNKKEILLELILIKNLNEFSLIGIQEANENLKILNEDDLSNLNSYNILNCNDNIFIEVINEPSTNIGKFYISSENIDGFEKGKKYTDIILNNN